MQKLKYTVQPDAFSKVIDQYTALDQFLAAEQEAKRQNYPGWLTLSGYSGDVDPLLRSY